MWVYQKPESSEPLEPLSAPSVPDSTPLKTKVTLPEPNEPFPASRKARHISFSERGAGHGKSPAPETLSASRSQLHPAGGCVFVRDLSCGCSVCSVQRR